MNLNILAYALYLFITIFIIVVVGNICYRNGNIFVAALVPDHEALCRTINRMLLIGYYLINIGYCGLTLVRWQHISSAPELVGVVALRSSYIILALAFLHYLNIAFLTKYIHKFIH